MSQSIQEPARPGYTFERLEERQMMSATLGPDAGFTDMEASEPNMHMPDIHIIDQTADPASVIAAGLAEEWEGLERIQLGAELEELDARLTDAAEDAGEARIALNNWMKKSTYDRSRLDAEDRVATFSNPTERQWYMSALGDHKRVIGDFLNRAEQILQYEAGGNWAAAANSTELLQRDIKYYHTKTKYHFPEFEQGVSFIQRGMALPNSVGAFKNEILWIRQQTSALQTTVLQADTAEASFRYGHQSLSAALAADDIDVRPASASLDGSDPAELHALDSALERQFNALSEHLIRIDQTDALTERVSHNGDEVILQMSHAEFSDLANRIATAVAQHGGDRAALIGALQQVFRASALHDLMEMQEEPEPVSVPEPSEELPAQTQEGPSAEDFSDMVSAIAAGIHEQLEAEDGIGYAKAHLTVMEHNGYSSFTIRFRNPGAQTFIEMIADNGDGSTTRRNILIDHPEGTEDMSHEFTLNQQTNVWGGKVEFKVWSGPDRAELLERIEANHIRFSNSARILTEQLPWDQEEEGRNAEEQVDPELKVIKITGPNVLFIVASPSDQSYVTFSINGLLAQQRMSHDGGTAGTLGTVTFNGSMQSGEYTLTLYDKAGGMVLDEIIVYWNSTTKALSLVHSDDSFMTLAGDALTEEEMRIFDRINNLTTNGIDNPQINWIQQMRLYQETDHLPAPYDVYYSAADLSRLFEEKFPQYKPENWEASISDMMRSMPGFTYSQVADTFHDARRDTLRAYEDALGTYENAMGALLQQAANIIAQIRDGGDQAALVQSQLMPLLERYLNPQGRNDWKADSTDIQMLGVFGIRLPDPNRLMDIAVRVLEQNWEIVEQTNADAVSYRAYQDAMMEKGLMQNALGEWEEAGGLAEDVPEGMDRRAISLAAKIARTLESSSDHRIVAYRYQIAISIASASENPSIEVIASAIETEFNGMIGFNPDVGGYDTEGVHIEDQKLTLQNWASLRQQISREGAELNLQRLQNLAFRSEGQLWTRFGNHDVRTDTEVGRILLGIAPLLESYSDRSSLARLCARVEEVFGINAIELYSLARYAPDNQFETALVEIFDAAGFDVTAAPPGGRTLAADIMYNVDTVRIAINPFDAVDMTLSSYKFIVAMMHSVMFLIAQIHESVVTFPFVGMNHTLHLHFAKDNGPERLSAAIGHNLCMNLSSAFQESHHDGFAIRSSAALATDPS